jgi:hypothetical protein
VLDIFGLHSYLILSFKQFFFASEKVNDVLFIFILFISLLFLLFTPKNVGKMGLRICIEGLWGIFSHDIFKLKKKLKFI